jgi:hypothetical protein
VGGISIWAMMADAQWGDADGMRTKKRVPFACAYGKYVSLTMFMITSPRRSLRATGRAHIDWAAREMAYLIHCRKPTDCSITHRMSRSSGEGERLDGKDE